MLKIGLTGGIGSGKSTVARLFRILNVPVYESDAEARKLLQLPEIINQIQAAFGKEILNETMKIDREKLADIVFKQPDKLQLLNEIIHPAVGEDFKKWCAKQTVSYVLKEAAILFDHGLEKQLDGVIAVICPDTLRIGRAAKRLGISENEIQLRINNQLPQDEIQKRANWLIINNEKQMLIPQVLQLNELLFNLAHETA